MSRPSDIELSELYLMLYSSYYYTDGNTTSGQKIKNLTTLMDEINGKYTEPDK